MDGKVTETSGRGKLQLEFEVNGSNFGNFDLNISVGVFFIFNVWVVNNKSVNIIDDRKSSSNICSLSRLLKH